MIPLFALIAAARAGAFGQVDGYGTAGALLLEDPAIGVGARARGGLAPGVWIGAQAQVWAVRDSYSDSDGFYRLRAEGGLLLDRAGARGPVSRGPIVLFGPMSSFDGLEYGGNAAGWLTTWEARAGRWELIADAELACGERECFLFPGLTGSLRAEAGLFLEARLRVTDLGISVGYSLGGL